MAQRREVQGADADASHAELTRRFDSLVVALSTLILVFLACDVALSLAAPGSTAELRGFCERACYLLLGALSGGSLGKAIA